jgi:HEAT repeat protein
MSDFFSEGDFFEIDPLFSSRRRPNEAEIEEIIGRFIDEQLSVVEAEAAIERLSRAEKRVLPRLMRLAASPDPHLHQTAIVLLREIGFMGAVPPLRELLEDPELEDDHKMSILHALDALGGLDPDENPFIYLRDPDTMFRKTQEATLSSFQDPLELEMVLQTIDDGSVPIRDNPNILPAMADIRDRRLLPLLLCLLHSPDDEMVIGAIDALALFEEPATARVLEERARYDPSPEVREAAADAAEQVAAELAEAEPPSILDLPVAAPPLVRCLVSTIDGNGGQILIVIREHPDDPDRYIFWDVMFNDHEGIKDCFGGRAYDDDEIETMIAGGLGEIGIGTLEISLERARAEVERAYHITLEAGRRLPLSYMGWQPWLQGEDPDPVEDYPLPGLAPDEERALLDRCDELVEVEEFESWFFNVEDLAGLDRRFARLTRRDPEQSKIEAFIGKAVKAFVDGERRRLLRDRLERQAWLLAQLYEGDEVPKMALAAAAGLSEGAPLPVEDHPLLREMMWRSLINAAGWGE